MSRVLPILFNTDMVRAILDGQKTVTRRVVKDCIRDGQEINKNLKGEFELYNITPRCGIPQGIIFKPPCQLGDVLYVRETWKRNRDGYSGIDFGGYIYQADCKTAFKDPYNPWHPSIHMPKEAARIWLKVTDVRVERLQDITPLGILAEGIRVPIEDEFDSEMSEEVMREFAFMTVWNSTIKKPDFDRYGWEANPWVWVIEFERCDRPEGWPG